MKRTFYLLLAAVISVPAYATHLMGGEMTATHIGGYDYEINLTTYRDTLGIPMASWATFELVDTGGMFVLSSSADVDPASGGLMPLFPYGVEVYRFKDTITMPGPGEYTIGWSNCCRNGAIINASSPLSESMYLFTNITVYDPAVAVNSSPEFLNEPVVFMPVGMPWSYNPLPFDPDGDSLSWSVSVPLDMWGDSIDGYYDPPGDTLGPFVIDAVTGTISWTPVMEGNFVASIAIDEYRGGSHIGRMVRDMQMIVVTSDDSLAKFGGLEAIGKNDDGYFWEDLKVGVPYSLELLGSDADAGDVLSMDATGAPFLFDTNPATFSFGPTGLANQIKGTMEWTPDASHVNANDYIVVYRLDDGIFATDLAVLYRVSSATGIHTLVEGFGATLFPNPAPGMAILRVELDRTENVDLRMFDADGRLLRQWSSKALSAGTNDLVIAADYAPGQYYVVLQSETHRQVLPLIVAD